MAQEVQHRQLQVQIHHYLIFEFIVFVAVQMCRKLLLLWHLFNEFLGGELDDEEYGHGKKVADMVTTPPPSKEKKKLMFKKVSGF